jgi:cobalt/nickel transport system permease protein
MVEVVTPLVAMHAPDGFLEPWVAAAAAAVSAGMLALALRHAGRQLGERQVPLAGLVAAFVFAAQMFNFPVAAGTTGHLLGGALAAILLGPSVGMLVVTVVVAVQALVFADGGLTALGYNVLNMAVVTAFGGWAVFHLVRHLLPRNATSVVAASALAAGASAVLSAGTFALEWLFGATAPVAFDDVFTAMVGVHALIGVGEGLMTAVAVGAVLAVRPDLVAGARDLSPAEVEARPRVGARPFVIGSLASIAVVAAVVSQFAADDPDGLETVAAERGFADQAGQHALADSMFADYATRGLDNATVSLAVAGLTGAALTLLVGYGLLAASRRAATPAV